LCQQHYCSKAVGSGSAAAPGRGFESPQAQFLPVISIGSHSNPGWAVGPAIQPPDGPPWGRPAASSLVEDSPKEEDITSSPLKWWTAQRKKITRRLCPTSISWSYMSVSSSQLLPVTRVRRVGPEKGHIGKMDDMAAKHIPLY
jgi:hypothetical protein